jgi:hypothetical protein
VVIFAGPQRRHVRTPKLFRAERASNCLALCQCESAPKCTRLTHEAGNNGKAKEANITTRPLKGVSQALAKRDQGKVADRLSPSELS